MNCDLIKPGDIVLRKFRNHPKFSKKFNTIISIILKHDPKTKMVEKFICFGIPGEWKLGNWPDFTSAVQEWLDEYDAI